MNVFDLVKKYPDKTWDWSDLSENSNIKMKDVLENPDKPWVWYWLSRNPNITMNDVLENPDKPWNLSGLSWNPNITIRFIEKNIDEIDFEYLSRNKFRDTEPYLNVLKHIMIKDINLIIVSY